MKHKMWVASPLMYIMAGMLVIWSLFSYNENKILFAAELTLAGLAVLATLLVEGHFRYHINYAVRSARKILTAEEEDELNELPLAIAVVGLQGDIVWSNASFRTNLGSDKDVLGQSILPYIYPRTLRQVSGEKGTAVAANGREFTVYTSKTDKSYVMYFVDDTYFKRIDREYKEKKPVVAIISFDNKDELLREASGGDESRITAEVETALRDWANVTMGGFVKKLSGGKYMMISDMAHFEQARQSRFQILDKVRAVKGVDNLSATISMGVGLGASSSAESEEWAKRALDMALGRGGDQVAVMKKGDTYEFYGGFSKGIEKRDKVRTRVIAATLSDHIKSSDKVLIMGHRNSDLDSVGSAIGMWAAVTKGLKKPGYIVINKNQTMAHSLIKLMDENYPDEKIFISPAEGTFEITDKTLLIVVDTHAATLVESSEVLNLCQKVVIIDHHRMMVNHIKNSVIFYHEPYASSAAEMVSELIQYMENVQISSCEAQALLSGIMLDTKNFIMKTGVRTFEACAYLRRKGADTVQVKKLFASSLSTNKEKASLVGSADIYKGCAIAYTDESTSATRVAAAQAADELLSIEGVKASFVLFRIGNEINISARSMGDINVQLVLEDFGGGGHLTMAGAQLKDTTIEDARLALIEDLDTKMDEFTNTPK